MTRRQLREETFKALFQYEFYKDEEDGDLKARQMRFFVEEDMDFAADEKQREEIAERVVEIAGYVDEIDARINEISDDWKTSRMNRVDLTLLRLAVYEMTVERLEEKIAINEAVELAKLYGTDDSGRFVNGVLGRIVRKA